MLSDRTMQFAEAVTTAVLGVDALWQRMLAVEHSDAISDRLVVLNMSRTHVPDTFASLDEARARLGELRQQTFELPEPDRRIYYLQFCDSTIAFTRWLDGQLPFQSQLPSFLHVANGRVSDERIDALKAEMRSTLTRLGYTGDLPAQAAAWEARHRVPPDEVAGVLTALMDEAWERTNRIIEIPADKSDGMRPIAETDVPYNARCDYERREVALNVDPVLTRPALKHLAVHECYPGHYLQFKLGEVWYARGAAPADMLLSVVNTASSCTFEGIADVGLHMIDWIEGDDDRLQGLLTRYRSAIGTRAAWRLHAEGWPREAVRAELSRDALIGGEGWVDNRMGFISAPDRSALIWSYWWGAELVLPAWQRVPPARQSDFYRFLFGRKHSPQSVAMFE